MPRPLIGITTDLAAAAWQDRVREVALSPAVYARAIERAGAAPVLLPPVLAGAAARLIAGLDGLMFSGGSDLGPRWHGLGADDPAGLAGHARDTFEIALARAAVEAGLPFLAISRGLQVLNVALGGTLVSPLASPVPPAPPARPAGGGPAASAGEGLLAGRTVRIAAGSITGRVFGTTATVPDSHHQPLDKLGRGLTPVAWAEDESVAAAEVTGHPFGVGLRWHPEESDDLAIFTQLRNAAEGSLPPAKVAVS
ncbi:MAG TPA: gamma-glutamyl-gamma-aminobutyrate hydrolase family protein [Streptosporangiaceae bacterium]|jgi:gamma-glutamyl-gamma-aminobutyrate hydrolase PuuD